MSTETFVTRAVVIAAALSVSACTSKTPPEPVLKVVEVRVPVAIDCVPTRTPGPTAFVDTDAALKSAAGPEDRFQLLAAGRIQRNQRLAILEPIIRGCRTP